jgi:RNA polymerase sigma-70 factor (ECF subfamily)
MHHESKTDQFVTLYAASQRRIYAFIRSQVLSAADADDVLQDTSVVLWRKFDEYEPGTDFTRWACRVARLEVLAFHRHRKRLLTVFSDEVADAIGEKVLELSDAAVVRSDALGDCVQLLSQRDREMLSLRYQSEQSVAEIATQIARTESTVYKSLQRIHDELYECVETKVKTNTPS